MGHDVVDRTVLRLFKASGYSLQANRKTREGASHPDRDAQFEHIGLRSARRPRLPQGRRSHHEQLANVNIARDQFHGEWNYTVKHSETKSRALIRDRW
jgi:hypothetical protein